MITAIRQKVTIGRGGLISLRSRALKAGSTAEVIVLVDEEVQEPVKKPMTGKDLLDSGLVGLWADRTDIGDSLEFAQALRAQAERRSN
ncbi:MAG: hypothetical protein WA821_13585 [Anaerolineales bacterium]